MEFKELLMGHTPRDFGVAGAISLAVLLIVWIVRGVIRHRFRDAHLTATDLDDLLLELARKTHLFLIFFAAINLGSRALQLPSQLTTPIRHLATIAFVAQTAFWAVALVEFWINRYKRRRSETDPAAVTTLAVFRIAAVVAIWAFAFVITLHNMGYNVTTLMAGLGIGGVAVALATQNILGDLFASLSIVVDKPFVVGETINVDTMTGRVEHIGMKTTRIRSVDGEELIISNGDLLKSRIRNYKRMVERRAMLRIGVTYDTPAGELEIIPQLIRTAVEAQALTRFDRAHFVAFGEWSLNFEAAYFVESADYGVFLDTQQKVNIALLRALSARGVDIAFPTQTVVNRDTGGVRES